MSVFIYEPNAFDKMCYAEGPDYLWNQRNFGICSFSAFLKEWRRIDEESPTLKIEYPNSTFDVDGNGAIYGFGGWNRYIVCLSGEIMMHCGFVEPFMIDTLWRALEKGFRIFPDEISGSVDSNKRNNKEWWKKRIYKRKGFKKRKREGRNSVSLGKII